MQRAGAEQDFAACAGGECRAAAPIGDAAGAAAVECDPRRLRVGFDAQVRAPARRAEVRRRGAAAPSSPGRQMVVAGALLHRAVEVVVAGNAELAGGGNDCVDQRVAAADRRAPERTVSSVIRRVAVDRMLEPLEIRQDVVVAPAGVTRRRPAVVVLALAAHADQPVDRAGATERLAARPVDPSPVHPGIGLGMEAPVVARVEHRFRVPDRNVDPRVVIRWPGLEQQHRVPAVGREPVGEHATGRSRADDDVVVVHPRILRKHPWQRGRGTQ